MAGSNLRNIDLFRHLSDERLAEVEQMLKSRKLAQDEVLFNMGDPGDELIIVKSGKIAIYAPDEENPGNEKPIRIFEKDDALGDMALIERKPRSLSAKAIEPSEILALGDADFRRFVAEDTDFAYAVMNGLSDRVRYTTNFLSEVRTWVGRVMRGEYNDETFQKEVEEWAENPTEEEDEEAAAQRRKDDTLVQLAAEFAQMAATVKEREDVLRREIAELKIEIDQSKRKQEVDGITKSDFFLDLQSKVKNMREEMQDDD